MQKRKSVSTLTGIIIIIIAVVILFGGVFAYQYFAVKTPSITQTQNQNNQTAGWKTYTNEKYGIDFKYPKKWGDILEHDEGDAMHVIRIATDNNGSDCIPVFGPKCKTSTDVEIFFSSYNMEDFIRIATGFKDPSVQISSQSKININNSPAIYYTYVSPRNDTANAVTPLGYFKYILVGIEKNSSLIEMTLNSPTFATREEANNYNVSDFNKFLSTIKFTN